MANKKLPTKAKNGYKVLSDNDCSFDYKFASGDWSGDPGLYSRHTPFTRGNV